MKCCEGAFVGSVASVDVAWQRVEMLQRWMEFARRQDQREAQFKACVCSRVHRMLSELGMFLWWAKFAGWRRQFEARVRVREGGGEEMLQRWTEFARRQDQREAQCKACVCSSVHLMLSELGMLLWWAKFAGWRRQFEARVRAREGGGEGEVQ